MNDFISNPERTPSSKAPALIQTIRWFSSPLKYLEKQKSIYGQNFLVKVFGWANLVLISKKEDVESVYAQPRNSLYAGEANKILEPMVGNASVFVLDGDPHLATRKALKSPFSKPNLKQLDQHIERVIKKHFNTQEDPVDFNARFRHITMDVMLLTIFGNTTIKPSNFYTKSLEPLLGPAIGLLAFFPFLRKDFGKLSPYGWYKNRVSLLKNSIKQEINAITSQESSPSSFTPVAHHLLRHAPPDIEQPEDWVTNQIISLLVAGNDTTGAAMSWALYWLSQNEATLSKLRKEVGKIPELNTNAKYEEILNNPYLDAIYKESLRIIPVVDFYSRAVKDHPSQKQYFISPCSYLFHRDPNNFHSPEKFLPERFLGKKYSPGEFSPFGGGVRKCIGEKLAEHIIKIFLFVYAKNYNISIKNINHSIPKRRNVILCPSKLKGKIVKL